MHTPHESPWVMLFLLVASPGCRSWAAPRAAVQFDLHFLEKWLEPVIEFGEADIHHTWACTRTSTCCSVWRS
ncbi:MAG: hypothetical protein R2713_20945 [Ilumatobacteraceae bacterium]